MAVKIQYLTYYIHLTDADAVTAYQALYPSGVNRAPYHATAPEGGAAIEFSAPWRGYSEPAAGTAPFTWSPFSNYGPADNPFPINVATFTRHTGGFFGIGGTTTTYYWMGQFVYVATPGVSDVPDEPVDAPATVAPYPQRRFIEGWERATHESGARVSIDASRHVGGMGLKAMSNDAIITTRAQDLYGATLSPNTWERFYLRLRRKPNVPVPFWRATAAVADDGGQLTITPSGQLGVEDWSGVTRTVLGTAGTLVLNEWTKVDVIVNLNSLAALGTGSLRIWLNGVLTGTFSVNGAATGLGNFSSNHLESLVGNLHTLTGHGGELDLDDWIASDVPSISAVESLTSPDWLGGTRIACARPASFGANHSVNWSGDIRVVMQTEGNDSVEAGAALTSSTASAVCEVTTDADVSIDADPCSRGVLSLKVLGFTYRGASSGSYGYGLAGAAAVDTAVTEAAHFSQAFESVMYRPSALTAPVDVTPLVLRVVKGASADAAGVQALLAEVEMVGTWGLEDVPVAVTDPPAFPSRIGSHNQPYPRTPWALDAASAPISPVVIFGGTYTGNNTGQDIAFNVPIHWLMVRRDAVGGDPAMWWSTMLAPHRLTKEATEPHAMVRAMEDVTFIGASGEDVQQQRFWLRIAGSSTDVNATGVTYQYIAVSDPGMRFMCNGAFLHNDSTTGNITTPLANADFTPEFLFGFEEALAGGFTSAGFVKSLGNAADAISRMQGSTETASITFAAGGLISGNTLHSALNSGENQLAYSAWRRRDGNNDPGEAAVFSCGSYTGDGNATANVICGTAGKRPLFALVIPENANDGYLRDPSHLTTASVDIDSGVDIATAIKAGLIDGFTVGVSLNANGIVHHYFVLWGSATAGNGGWSINGTFTPVEANSPADGPWPDDPDVPTDEESETPLVDVVCEPDFETDDEIGSSAVNVGGWCGGHACEYYTRSIVNIALSRIGITDVVANLLTENTENAAMARRHVREDITTTLREFPWPFATRYADLVLVGGTETVPVNADWQYSYRAPSAMVMARRIVGQAGQKRAYDPDPPKFRLGSDATGPLIYTDLVATDDVPVVLEYTERINCPAFYGDALFRDALAWRLASSLAMALARDSKKQAFCMQMYEMAKMTAEAPAANEQQQEKEGDASWISDRG